MNIEDFLTLYASPIRLSDAQSLNQALNDYRLTYRQLELPGNSVHEVRKVNYDYLVFPKVSSASWRDAAKRYPPQLLAKMRDLIFTREVPPHLGHLFLYAWPPLAASRPADERYDFHHPSWGIALTQVGLPFTSSDLPAALVTNHLADIEWFHQRLGLAYNPSLVEAAARAGGEVGQTVQVTQALLTGDMGRVAALAPSVSHPWTRGLLTAVLQGDAKQAAVLCAKSAPAASPSVVGLLRLVVLATSSQSSKLATVARNQHYPEAQTLQDFAREGEVDSAVQSQSPLVSLANHLPVYWCGHPVQVHEATNRAKAGGWAWVAEELQVMAGGAGLRGAQPLATLRPRVPLWARTLDELEGLAQGERGGEDRTRLAWFFQLEPFFLEARTQTLGPQGWSSGRRASLERLAEAKPGEVRAVDQEVLNAWLPTAAWPVQRQWDLAALLTALAKHPAAFDASGAPLEISFERPTLDVRREAGQLVAVFDPPPGRGPRVSMRGTQHRVVQATPTLTKLLAPLKGEPLRVPIEQSDRLYRWIGQLGDEIQTHGQPEVPGDTTPVLVLRPVPDGLSAELRVQPAGEEGAFYRIGERPNKFVTTVGGRAVRVVRDREAERAELRALLEHVPELEDAEDGLGLGFADALDVLDKVQALPELVRVAWPEGAELKVRRPRGKVRFEVTSQGNWFQAVGELVLDEQRTLSLVELLAAAREGSGRFLRLKDGSFVALTEQLRRQLTSIDRLGRVKGKSLQIHALASELLEPLVGESQDAGWREVLRKRKEIPADPPLPAGLTATLRPYQEDGLRWLIRLTHWAPGACLADDMGLGKTVTSLGLLLFRARLGPALVVAPASVLSNWQREARRFAPSLKFRDLATGSRDLSDLSAGEVVLCSYGLLVTEAERLTARPWSTVVLDEAHQIKNAETQRHKAACALKGDFRLALSGTPIENRLEELHALLQFVAPEFLGAAKDFRTNFVRPITSGDREVSRGLRRLVAPLLLRRTKAEVLDDLPPRTDIDLLVELDSEHANVYEAVRRESEALLTDRERRDPLLLLAQLTRLRLAACHPALVGFPSIPSSKHERLRELLLELRAAGHRALLFSQFVKHLELVRAWMVEQDLSFSWLVGSSSRAERDQAVSDFQEGKRDFFLLSLKAGGAGLNLTAADYVIHLDPWWNPAVEDQASDRAHRIGQQRPVTIYRLIAQATVEQQILALHHTKRDLADQLLAEAHLAAGLDTQQLLSLLAEATQQGSPAR